MTYADVEKQGVWIRIDFNPDQAFLLDPDPQQIFLL
jgi:hypothetical protein